MQKKKKKEEEEEEEAGKQFRVLLNFSVILDNLLN